MDSLALDWLSVFIGMGIGALLSFVAIKIYPWLYSFLWLFGYCIFRIRATNQLVYKVRTKPRQALACAWRLPAKAVKEALDMGAITTSMTINGVTWTPLFGLEKESDRP